MVTTLAIVFVLLLVVGTAGMVVLAFRGELFAKVWLCCGGLGSSVELIGSLVALVIGAIAEAVNG